MTKTTAVGVSKHALLLGLTLSGFGCGGAAAPPKATSVEKSAAEAKPAPQEKPFDIEAVQRVEASGLSEQLVQGPGGVWSTKVPALSAPQVAPVDDVVMVEIPIGPNAEVRCQVFAQAVDPAGTMFEVIKESAGRVQYQSVETTSISLFGDAPAASVQAVYFTDVDGGKAAGGLKMAIHAGEARATLCVLDDLGYQKTFEQVSSAFFSGFRESAPTKSDATYAEVSKASVEGVDIGFGVTRLVPSEKPGEKVFHSFSTHLVPVAEKDLSFEDSYTVLALDKKGQLKVGSWVEMTNGELQLQMKLTREADGKLSYEGTALGKPVKGTLLAPKGISTALDNAQLLKKKLKSAAPFEVVVAEYHPSLDPAAPVNVTYSRAKGAPPRQVVMKLGEQVFTAEVDENGMPGNGFFQVGEQRLLIKREHVRGTLD